MVPPAASGEVSFRSDVFDWCLRHARRCVDRGDLDDALRWLEIAGRHATEFPFGRLASAELEALLLEIARRLRVPPSTPGLGQERAGRHDPRARWLHVFTQVYEIGGHTAMAARWFVLDGERRHSAVLLDQRDPVPDFFAQAVAGSGGQLQRLDPARSPAARAAALRSLAWTAADVVVLHVHPWDVIPTVAFGVPGGPRVLLVDHADHVFWIGGAVADVVLDLRPAGEEYTHVHRGIPRTRVLPILIPSADGSRADVAGHARGSAAARTKLGIPADGQVMLTVAHGHKYRPLPARGLDYLEAVRSILVRHPRAWLLAVGPHPDGRWAAVAEATSGRARAEGPTRDLALYHAAADLYLETFPIGSATALLEAASEGIACVRAPHSAPPPTNTGGPGILVVDPPADLDAYVREASELLESATARAARGAAIAASVAASHGPRSWLDRLRGIVGALPAEHRVHPLPAATPLSGPATAFWVEWSRAAGGGNALLASVDAALDAGLSPRIDRPLRAAARRPDRSRAQDGARLRFVLSTASALSVLTPAAYARVYRQLERALGQLRRAR